MRQAAKIIEGLAFQAHIAGHPAMAEALTEQAKRIRLACANLETMLKWGLDWPKADRAKVLKDVLGD